MQMIVEYQNAELRERWWVWPSRSRPCQDLSAVVLNVFSRRVVGWSIDSSPTSNLVTSALGMAIDNRTLVETVIHWTRVPRVDSTGGRSPTEHANPGLPSLGSVGDCFHNAVVESFWARMRVELLDRRRSRTRIELANALHEYLKTFHNLR